jgi:hypothetical protein
VGRYIFITNQGWIMHILKSLLILVILFTSFTSSGNDAFCKNLIAKFNVETASTNSIYNMACCSSINKNSDDAFSYLEFAITKGYTDLDWMEKDTDLTSLHSDTRWKDIVSKVKSNRKKYFSKINIELYKIYNEDQGDRQTPKIDWEKVNKSDQIRRARVTELVNDQQLSHSDDYYHAAMIFQHGDSSDNYKKAYELSKKSAKLDSSNKKAKWLACASEDRYLQKIGKPQIWGTQYQRVDMNSPWTLEPFDRTIKTDKDRVLWGVRTISESSDRLKTMNSKEKI